ncbi:AAA-like domain-containing protein [Alkalinema pantanalense CENA528]|uniref:AAA-like domain-containing protein n=1 Tax=Alkalinema pantanalense TaxID=1620705 RepID=UPI003D6F9306
MPYQVGGSLPPNASTYVYRRADEVLFHALKTGHFCYVFNARQMGKSSLRLQTALRLQAAGIHCATIDLTEVGTQRITIDQWYAAIAAYLLKRLQISFPLVSWWQERQHLSNITRLNDLIETIILKQITEPLVIFIDEIDSVLGLSFPTDDFFALIRHWFNQRPENPQYQRLTFCLIGVTTPSQLIANKLRTPFNIGQAIELQGFQFDECHPLLAGLSDFADSQGILQRILYWTNGQPFLTQKLCSLIKTYDYLAMQGFFQEGPNGISLKSSQNWVDEVVETQILARWESQDEPEHLKTIRDRLLQNPQTTSRLLGLYQQILATCNPSPESAITTPRIETDQVSYDSPEATELLLTGLIEKQHDQLGIKNRIYQQIFTWDWVSQQLSKLRPYDEALNAWVASGQTDDSRLLRGQALLDAQQWSRTQSLSDLDYQFLAASEKYDRREMQQALEAERANAVEAELLAVQRAAKFQRFFLCTTTAGLGISLILGLTAFLQYRNAIGNAHQAKLNEIQALASSSQGLSASNRQLDAMVEGIKAKLRLQELQNLNEGEIDRSIQTQVETALRQAVYTTNEFNQLQGHQGGVLTVDISPDGQFIATGSNDKTVKLWTRDGAFLRTLPHSATIHRVAFGPDSQHLVTGGLDGTINLWRIDGTLVKTMSGHPAPVWGVAFSPDGQLLASASGDRTIKVWHLDGTLKSTLQGHQKAVWNVAFSADGRQLVSAGFDHTVRFWTVDGKLLKTQREHQGPVWDIALCQQSNQFVSASADRTAKVWRADGSLVRTLASTHPILGVGCSRNGEYIATSGTDKFAKIWKSDGTFIRTLKQHNAVVRDVALGPNGLMAVSASDDGLVKLWRRNHYLLVPMNGHQDIVWEMATSPDGKLVATVSGDETLKLWRTDGRLIQTLQIIDSGFRSVTFSPDSRMLITGGNNLQVQLWDLGDRDHPKIRLLRSFEGHKASIYAVAISPDGKTIASGSDDNTIKLWSIDGQLLHSIKAHKERIWKLAFSPDGKRFASASEDGTAKLWSIDGQPIATLPGQGAVWGVAFSPKGDRLVSASRDDTFKLWRSDDGSLIRTIVAQSQGLTRIAFSPDGTTIATAGVDNTVKFWSPDGQLRRTLPGHHGFVASITFTPDGKHLVSGSDDSSVILWDLPKIRALNELDYACKWVSNYLQTNPKFTDQERQLCQFPGRS